MVKYEKIINEQNSPLKFLRFLDDHVYDAKVDPHWHNSIEIIVSVIGDFKMWDNGIEYTIHPGDIHIINTRNIHSFYEVLPTEQVYNFAIQIKYDFIKEIFKDIDDYYFIQPSDEIKELMLDSIFQLDYLLRQNTTFNAIRIKGQIYDLLYNMLEYLARKREDATNLKSHKNMQRIVEIIKYIENHYHEGLSVEQIAFSFDLERSYLSRFFKEHTGNTLKEYIVSVCLNHAYHDLIETDLPIIEITYKNGFPNENSLINAFKHKYYQTPLQYRKNVTKQSFLNHK